MLRGNSNRTDDNEKYELCKKIIDRYITLHIQLHAAEHIRYDVAIAETSFMQPVYLC